MILLYLIGFLLINISSVCCNSPPIKINIHELLDQGIVRDISFNENDTVRIIEGDSKIISWTSTARNVRKVQVFLDDDFTAELTGHEEFFTNDDSSLHDEYFPVNITSSVDDVTVYGYINITAKFVGYNQIKVMLLDSNNQEISVETLDLAIILRELYITKVYTVLLTIVLISVYTTMGANLDLNLVKRIVKQPVGPLIGLFCQYGCMPLIAFGLGILVFPDDPLLRLGLFVSGSSPGGGLSNMWTHLLGGSLDLSIMMTFASTVVALGAVPLWLLTLGPVIVKDAKFVIPYVKVITGVFVLIVPCFIGILIQLKLPRVAKILQMIITPLSILNILFIFTFGIYANFYLFSYITWQAVLGGFGQSICGHLAGIFFALLFRRNRKDVIAISVETAVQNNGIAFLLLKLSLESPAGDIAVLMPGCVTLFMPLPLAIACLCRAGYLKCYLKGTDQDLEKVDPTPDVAEGNAMKGLDNPTLIIEEDHH